MNESELASQMLKYQFGLRTLQNQLSILLDEYSFANNYNPVEHIKSRIKSKESALNKLEKRGYDLTVENLIEHVHDMIGIRIVVSFLSDVKTIVELIKSSGQLIILREKDYISNPKDSGYISYHLLVKVPVYLDGKIELIEAEIQIRTIAMDFWASLDHKIKYKFDSEIPEEVKNEMYKCALDIQSLDEKMQNLNSIMDKYK